MIIAVDIGNTNISVAGFEEASLEPLFIKQYPDNRFHSADEFFTELEELEERPRAAVICSVVPVLGNMVKTALERFVGDNVFVIDSNFNDGLLISGYDRRRLGNDRIADMTAVKALYGTPAVIFDMGTATTVSVLDKNEVFVGGMILPGLGLSLNALSSGTALLPGIKPYSPNCLLGQDTVSCINNGVIYSQVSAIEGISARIEEAFGESVKTVITGGAAKFIIPLCKRRVIYDSDLLIKGIKILYDNRKILSENEDL